MTPTATAAARGLLTTGGTVVAVGAVVALAGGAAGREPSLLALAAGVLAVLGGVLWPLRRTSVPSPGTGRAAPVAAAVVTDVVEQDGSTVLSGRVVVVSYDPASPRPPTSRSTYVTRRHGRGTRVEFALVRLPDRSLRAYVLDGPSYGRRSSGAHETHRLRDQHGRPYVCWDTRIDQVEQIMWVAREWAERTVRYVEHGTAFTATDPGADEHTDAVERENRSRQGR